MNLIDAMVRRSWLIAVLAWSCSGTDPGKNDAGNNNVPEKNAEIYLDGKQLLNGTASSNSSELFLEEGEHQLELRDGSKYTLSGDITGPGVLKVNIKDPGVLYLSGKQLHKGTILESGNLDLVDAGYFAGNVTVLNETGVARRLAIPTDISSELRAWFDGSDLSTAFSDTELTKLASQPGDPVVAWKNRAWEWPIARLHTGAISRSFDLKSLSFQGGAFAMKDLYLKDKVNVVAAIRPTFQSGNSTAILTTNIVDGILPVALGAGLSSAYGTTPQIGLGTYSSTGGAWKNVPEVTLGVGNPVLIGGFIGPAGAELQIDGTTVRANNQMKVSQAATGSTFGRFTYYIARRWDADNMYLTDISELAVVADTTSIDAITGYIAWHNNLQDKLPSNHPYKLKPPIATVKAKEVTVQYECSDGKTCSDFRKVLCGPLCAFGDTCITNADCGSWNCVNEVCAAPACSTGCAVGAKCGESKECTSGKCESGFCVN